MTPCLFLGFRPWGFWNPKEGFPQINVSFKHKVCARRSKNKQHLSNFEGVQASKLRVQSVHKNITSFPPYFLSSQFLHYLCETGTRRFVRSRRICSVYPGKRPFGLFENIFEIHLHQAILRFPCCHRRRLASPFRCWRAPFFNFLHGELNLSQLRKTLASAVWFSAHWLKSPLFNFLPVKVLFAVAFPFLGQRWDVVYNLIIAAKNTWWN